MSIKSKVLAGAAAATMATGMGALAASAAHASTPSCDGGCVEFYSPAFGSAHNPKFVMDVLRQGQKAGQPVILYRTSNNDPAEDFTLENQGYVSDFTAAGLISKSTNLHYGGAACQFDPPTNAGSTQNSPASPCTAPTGGPGMGHGPFFADLPAFEIEYSPYGVGSGLCVGTWNNNGTGKVTLESCGTSAKTVWIADTSDRNAGAYPGYNQTVPLINGAQTNFSHPYVLTYPQNSYPTDMPRPQLETAPLQTTSHGVLSDLQLWGAVVSQGGPGGGPGGGPVGPPNGGGAPS